MSFGPIRFSRRWGGKRWYINWIQNIKDAFYDIWYGCYNIIRWTPVIWFDADFDSGFLIEIMEYKFRRMAAHFNKYGHHTLADRDARQLLICATLCKRLQEDNYYDNARATFGESRAAILQSIDVQRNDQMLLGRLIGKKLTHWWD